MDSLLILAISFAERVLLGEIALNTDKQKQFAIAFFDSQSEKLAINRVGATPYGLTDEQRTDFVGSLIFAAAKLEGVKHE